jgi:Flp pilus assembly secretin CpaC
MRAMRLVLGISLLFASGRAVGDDSTAPSGPTPPRPVAVPGSSAPSAEFQRLQQKLAQRDVLQREIEELSRATQTPQQVLVRVQMIQVNLSKLKQLGMDFVDPLGQSSASSIAAPPPGDGLAGDLENEQPTKPTTSDHEAFRDFLMTLRQHGVAQTLADPSVVTVSGRPASVNVGGNYPMPGAPGSPNAVEYGTFGTELKVVATAIGNNRVRLDVHPRVSTIDAENSIVVNGQSVPTVHVQQCDTSCEATFGETIALSGMVSVRPSEDGKGIVRQGLWVFVTPELVEAGAQPPVPFNEIEQGVQPPALEQAAQVTTPGTRFGAKPGTVR